MVRRKAKRGTKQKGVYRSIENGDPFERTLSIVGPAQAIAEDEHGATPALTSISVGNPTEDPEELYMEDGVS
ncbi:hypothetical protein CVT25_012005 [Psilocybe cyanescens]|uniref:Uncharacterized protein n=1 Tax=Psilocybe cyanescens TaxID=93625 RepID=A0A409XFE2_PSICY|nr:hypothetical protein CVT25_012005 [Psilocybe cyanescens]